MTTIQHVNETIAHMIYTGNCTIHAREEETRIAAEKLEAAERAVSDQELGELMTAVKCAIPEAFHVYVSAGDFRLHCDRATALIAGIEGLAPITIAMVHYKEGWEKRNNFAGTLDYQLVRNDDGDAGEQWYVRDQPAPGDDDLSVTVARAADAEVKRIALQADAYARNAAELARANERAYQLVTATVSAPEPTPAEILGDALCEYIRSVVLTEIAEYV